MWKQCWSKVVMWIIAAIQLQWWLRAYAVSSWLQGVQTRLVVTNSLLNFLDLSTIDDAVPPHVTDHVLVVVGAAKGAIVGHVGGDAAPTIILRSALVGLRTNRPALSALPLLCSPIRKGWDFNSDIGYILRHPWIFTH